MKFVFAAGPVSRSGINKTFLPMEKLAKFPFGGWVEDFSVGFLKTIGVLEILAAVDSSHRHQDRCDVDYGGQDPHTSQEQENASVFETQMWRSFCCIRMFIGSIRAFLMQILKKLHKKPKKCHMPVIFVCYSL
jgi:hypothetical protein